MEVYLDHAATTWVYDDVCRLMCTVMAKDYGNPSSLHMKGVEAEKYMKEAKAVFAGLLKTEPKEIYFTSGGTESNNTALIGGAMANARSGKHIISTSIEHASVYNPLLYLESQGFEITWLPVDGRGVVSLEALRKALRPDTILVSVMCVNNEIGTVQPLDKIGKIIKDYNKDILFHVDAIQGFGKMRIYPKRLGIDLLSISGHKIHGPKGTGVLYMRDKVKLRPLMFGGGQQRDMRSGTENVPGIAGMARAAQMIYEDFDQKTELMYARRDEFVEALKTIEGTVIHGFEHKVSDNGDMYACTGVGGDGFSHGPAPHIVSAAFENIRAEVLLHALEERGVYVSSGSACSSNHPAISGTLKAIGVPKKYLDATVRFSMCAETTKEELDECVDQLRALIPVLRRYTLGGRR